MKAIAARLHSSAQDLGALKATQEEWDEQRSDLARPLKQIPLIEAHTSRGLSLNQTLNFVREDGNELECNDEDHHKGVCGHAYFLKGGEKSLHTVGQVYQRGT